ncbi:MAG TPA: TonB family protein [Terriglobales bacterium]|jgi:TonB family protein
MNRVFSSFLLVQALHGSLILAQSQPSNSAPNAGTGQGPLEVRSNTKGFDLRKYTNKLFSVVRSNWYEEIPEEARDPQRKAGKVTIDFRVMKDGTITDVNYLERSGNEALDRAAFASIIHSSPLKPLPAKFECAFAAYRFHFLYNPDELKKDDLKNTANSEPLQPCVTSTIRVGDTEIPK